MKLFRVLIDEKVEIKKEPEIVRKELRFAAYNIEDVWDKIEWIRDDEEQTVIAIIEDAPAIVVLPRKERSRREDE